MKVISPKGLDNLKEYGYHCNDRSILAKYVMQPFWNRLINFMPTTIAPNLITLLGFFGILFSYLALVFYNPKLDSHVPHWVYYFASVCLFWYQTMDALDGKQARRTKTSSPLGELFDHGCDSMTTTLMGITLAGTVKMGPGLIITLVSISGYTAFFATQWEEFHTGHLDLAVLNVTEIQILTMIIYSATALLQPDFWVQEVSIFGQEYAYNLILGVIILIGTSATFIGNIINVTKLNKGFSSFTQVYPMILIWIGAALSYRNSNFAFDHPNLYLITIGFLFSYITGMIVTKRVCKERFPLHYLSIYAYLALSNYHLWGHYIPNVSEYLLHEIFAGVVVIQYLVFAVIVINQMTTHLKIKCLSIPHTKSQ